MALEYGTQAYKNALDGYITGNYGGADMEEEPNSDDFNRMACDKLREDGILAGRSLIRNSESWGFLIEWAALDENAATKAYTALCFPETDGDREMVMLLETAASAIADLLALIPLDQDAVEDRAKMLAHEYETERDGRMA